MITPLIMPFSRFPYDACNPKSTTNVLLLDIADATHHPHLHYRGAAFIDFRSPSAPRNHREKELQPRGDRLYS